MAWCDHAVAELRAGRRVEIRPKGHSMCPRIQSGALVLLEPVRDPASLRAGQIVLAKVRGSWYLHLISATDPTRVQIANNRGHVNGWVARSAVVGRVVEIDNP
jgi:SOS-response transcriptional repressor LexA